VLAISICLVAYGAFLYVIAKRPNSKARFWLTSNEIKSVMEKSGVLGSPSIRFAAAA
jgi:hypothetical protein